MVINHNCSKRLGCVDCSILMMQMEKNKNILKGLLQFFLLLFFWAIYPSSYAQDSLSSTQDLVWKGRQAQVEEWKNAKKSINLTIDSIRKNLSSGSDGLDSIALTNTVVSLQAEKERISNYIDDINKTRDTWLSLKKQVSANEDSTIVKNAGSLDSLRSFGEGWVDSLPPLIAGYEGLITEVVHLEKMAVSLRTDKVVADFDSIANESLPSRRRVAQALQTNLGKDGSSSDFFGYPAWSSRFFLVLISLFYLYWMYKLSQKSESEEDELRLYQNDPLWIPVLKAVIFFLVLLPFTSSTVPVLILEGTYFIVFVLLFVILYKELSLFKRKVLLLVFISYILLVSSNLVLSVFWWSKVFAIFANGLGIAVVWFMGRRTDIDNPIGYIHRYARWLIIFGHLLAIVLNIAGYISVARMWSLAAGIGLLQVIALRSVREMLLHDIEKQYERARPEALFRRFDRARVLLSFDRLFRFFSFILIVLVVLNNFHLTSEALSHVEQLLMAEHKFGGVTFSYGNLMLAILVIWLANWLQKSLKNLLNDTSPKDELQVRRMTLFPLFRLLIIVLGFLLGVSILGLGMDKLTVIVGALSVGVGLGLQNVINNFVSGIILVFEKPFKIGDYVELADKKGQVREIGIRSSTLLTDEGARVIIPNGDLLSGRLVNWTFREADIRVNLKLTVDNIIPIEEVKKELKSKLLSFEEIDRSIAIKIFTKDITPDNYQLTIQVGVKHVRYIERFRSLFLESFKKDMDAQGIKVSSS